MPQGPLLAEDCRVSKPSTRSARRQKYAHELAKRGVEMPFPCSTCERRRRRCVLSKDEEGCVECVRYSSKECDIGLSQAQLRRLDKAKEDLLKQLEDAENREIAAEEAESAVRAEILEKECVARSRKLEARATTRRLRKQLASVRDRTKEMFAKELAVIEHLEELDRREAEKSVAETSSVAAVGEGVSVSSPAEGFPELEWSSQDAAALDAFATANGWVASRVSDGNGAVTSGS